MVVKAVTKKWLMDNGLDQHTAHAWADGKSREELLKMNFNETMHHLYQVTSYYASSRYGIIIGKKTFFKDGPPKDMGFFPFTMTFTDVIGKDIRYDDYIYQYIQGVKRKYKHMPWTLPTSEYFNLITVWGKKDKKETPFINYDELPWSEK